MANLRERLKNIESVQALVDLVRENGIDISEEKAAAVFDRIRSGAIQLSDEELNGVAGGAFSSLLDNYKENLSDKTLMLQPKDSLSDALQ